MLKIFKSAEKIVAKHFKTESSGHDLYHLRRVFNVAMNIQSVEGGDKLVIGVAALLHDVHRLMDDGKSNKAITPEESLPKVKKLLDGIDVSDKQKAAILKCILFHENYNFANDKKIVLDLETQILQDADRIDAIGAIGVARCFTYSGHYNIPMWLPELGINNDKYNSTIKDPSAIHHFNSKLLKLGGDMNTITGRRLAKNRHDYIKKYLEQFLAEWAGEK
jgi:uncharacterized protein